jgi:hypothetical protein
MELTGAADERMIGGDVKSKRTEEEVDRGGGVQRADASEVQRLVRPEPAFEETHCPQCAMTREQRIGYKDNCPMNFPEHGCPFYDKKR